MDYGHYRRGLCVQATTLAFFAISLSVSPPDQNTSPEVFTRGSTAQLMLFVHTTPFLLAQIGLASMSMTSYFYDCKSGYAERLQISGAARTWDHKLRMCFLLVVALKMVTTLLCLALLPLDSWMPLTAKPYFVSYSRFIDLLFMALAIGFPVASQINKIKRHPEKLEYLCVRPTLTRAEDLRKACGSGDAEKGTVIDRKVHFFCLSEYFCEHFSQGEGEI